MGHLLPLLVISGTNYISKGQFFPRVFLMLVEVFRGFIPPQSPMAPFMIHVVPLANKTTPTVKCASQSDTHI